MPVNRKGLPRAEREAAIVTEAERLFLTLGFHETAVSEIAKSLGLTANAVTWYFPTKDDLLAVVLDRWTRRTVATLDLESVVANGPGRDALATALEAFRPYRGVYAVVHERMHHSAAVHRWHEQSQALLTGLADLMLTDVCTDERARRRLVPLLVALVEINLLHFQEDERTAKDLLAVLVGDLVAATVGGSGRPPAP